MTATSNQEDTISVRVDQGGGQTRGVHQATDDRTRLAQVRPR
jgi:hypothetical protein